MDCRSACYARSGHRANHIGVEERLRKRDERQLPPDVHCRKGWARGFDANRSTDADGWVRVIGAKPRDSLLERLARR